MEDFIDRCTKVGILKSKPPKGGETNQILWYRAAQIIIIQYQIAQTSHVTKLSGNRATQLIVIQNKSTQIQQLTDGQRTIAALKGVEGKRLYYKSPSQ